VLAVSIRGPGLLEVVEVARPVVASPTDAVVMVSTAGLGPIDIERFRRGDPGPTPGGEFCGTVVELGADVSSFDIDDLVFGTTAVGGAAGRLFGRHVDGGHAEYVLVPDADHSLVKTNAASEERSLMAGGSLGLGAAAAELAIDACPSGGTVAVIGCDPCGLGAVAWLRQRRIPGVLAMDTHAARSTLAKRYGAAPVSLEVLTNGAEVVIAGDLSDGPGVEAIAYALKPGGTLIFCRPGESDEWHARFKETGVAVVETRWPNAEFASRVASHVHTRRLDLLPAVSHVIPLDDALEAYEAAAGLVPSVQKVLLKP
jgi:hypothetical protein